MNSKLDRLGLMPMLPTSIITDSNAFLDNQTQRSESVIVVPNRIQFLGQVMEESRITANELLERVTKAEGLFSKNRPQVLPPCPLAVQDAIGKAAQVGQEILAIHMSGHFSPMYCAMESASRALNGVSVRVVDSHTVSLGLGQLVAQAASASASGQTLAQVSRSVSGEIPSFYVSFFAESMHYLEDGAKMGSSLSLLSAMLELKAMFLLEDGQLLPFEKVRTKPELVERLFDFIAEFTFIRRVGIMHHAYGQVVQDLKARLLNHNPRLPVVELPYPPSLAVHLGPNIIGVVIHEGTK